MRNQSDFAQVIYDHLKRIKCNQSLIAYVMCVINGRKQEYDWLTATKSPREVEKNV